MEGPGSLLMTQIISRAAVYSGSKFGRQEGISHYHGVRGKTIFSKKLVIIASTIHLPLHSWYGISFELSMEALASGNLSH
ncbi:hypothetical protein EJB05_39571, partial [Eragrostis curvula]